MTKIEAAKVTALQRCRFGFYAGNRQQFVRQLVWVLQNDSKKNLSWKQKFFLDALIWNFRSQIAAMDQNNLGFQLPAAEPVEADYDPQARYPHPQELLPL